MTTGKTFSRIAVPAFLGCLLLAPFRIHAADASVEQRLKEMDISFEVDSDDDYKILFTYKEEGRSQLVFVSGSTETAGGFVVREVYSPAAEITKDHITGDKAIELMQESERMILGSWELRGDTLFFVIKLAEPLSSTQLKSAMFLSAEAADEMEKKLSGARDDF